METQDLSAKELKEQASYEGMKHSWADCMGYDCAQPSCPISGGTGKGRLGDADQERDSFNEARSDYQLIF